MGQVVHQIFDMKSNVSLYVASAESGIINKVLMRYPLETRRMFHDDLDSTSGLIVESAHDFVQIPDFLDKTILPIVVDRVKLWRVVQSHVASKGCFVSLKKFNHSSKSLKSKVRAVIDVSTQQRAILRSSTPRFKWEQNIVSKTMKTLAINAFLG